MMLLLLNLKQFTHFVRKRINQNWALEITIEQLN